MNDAKQIVDLITGLFTTLVMLGSLVWGASKILNRQVVDPVATAKDAVTNATNDAEMRADLRAMKVSVDAMAAKLDTIADHDASIRGHTDDIMRLEKEILLVREKHHEATNKLTGTLLTLVERLTTGKYRGEA